MKKEENQYKSLHSSLKEELRRDLEQNLDKFKDPIIMGELVYMLLKERENTNRILKTLNQRLEQLEAKLRTLQVEPAREQRVLSEIDQKIMAFIEQNNMVTAKDVQKKFKYKGTNAASMRLNRLYREGLLTKQQAGKKVYYAIKK